MPASERITRLVPDIGALLAGLAVPFAFAPYHYAWLLFPTLAALLFIWHKSTPGRAFRRGYLFGLGMFGFGVYWLHISINLFGGVNLVLALLATYLLVAFLALYPAITGWLLCRWCSAHPLLALVIAAPALWVLSEWLRSWFLTGFPWLNLGYSQIETPLAGFAPLVGVYGVSWISMIVAGLLATLLLQPCYRRLVTTGVVTAIFVVGLGLKQHEWVEPDGITKRVALVQGAVPQAIKWKPEQLRESMHLYYDLSRPFWKEADMVIWPETAIPAFTDQLPDYIDALREQAIALDTPLIAGLATRDQGDGRYYNSLLAIGAHEDIYHKRHLVPFGEYLPLKALLQPFLSFLEIPMSDFSAGDAKRPLLDVGNLKAGVSICYEDTFGEEVIQALPDADFLINVSNDAWFGDSIAPHQHLQMARFRSLESGRYMLRSTNTGISAIIDHNGNVTARSPQFASDVLISKMRLYSGSTPYVITGNATIIWICVISLAVLLLAGRHTSKRPEENP